LYSNVNRSYKKNYGDCGEGDHDKIIVMVTKWRMVMAPVIAVAPVTVAGNTANGQALLSARKNENKKINSLIAKSIR